MKKAKGNVISIRLTGEMVDFIDKFTEKEQKRIGAVANVTRHSVIRYLIQLGIRYLIQLGIDSTIGKEQ